MTEPRRLWLGQWQQEDQDDVVVISPDETAEERAERDESRRKAERLGIAAAAVAALFVLAFVLGSGGENRLSATARALALRPPVAQFQLQPQPQLPQQQATPGQGFGGPDLGGSAAAKAAAAALRQFPGQVERVTSGPSGSDFVVHVFTPDGYEVHVLVGRDFHVEGSDGGSGPPATTVPGTSG